MKRKTVLLVVLSLLSFAFSGCESSESQPFKVGIERPFIGENITVPVFDTNGEEITQITCHGMVELTDEGILYRSFSDKGTFDYYHYKFENNETLKIGEIKDWDYETVYDRKIINGHLYTFITTGNMLDPEERVLHLYDFDLSSGLSNVIYSQPGGFPYALLETLGNDLIVVRDVNGDQSIERFDTSTRTFEPMISYFYDNDLNCGDAVRHISTDGEVITVLRVSNTDGNDRLFLDCYDTNFNLISNLEISELFSVTDDPNNEIKQGCEDFFFSRDILYYENFSSTRFLTGISENGFDELIDNDINFSSYLSLTHNIDNKVFYRGYTNSMYIYNIDDNAVDNVEFYAPNDKYVITGGSFNSKDEVLISMNYRDPSTGERLPSELYFTNLSELMDLSVKN